MLYLLVCATATAHGAAAVCNLSGKWHGHPLPAYKVQTQPIDITQVRTQALGAAQLPFFSVLSSNRTPISETKYLLCV